MASIQNLTIELTSENDGIHLTITRNEKDDVISREEVMEYIEKYQIKDIDFVKLNLMILSEDMIVSDIISQNNYIYQKNEKCTVDTSGTKLEAYITFEEPVNGGKRLTADEIRQAIAHAGIKFGLIDDVIEGCCQKRAFSRPYLIAEGDEPIDGVDGYLEFYFDATKKDMRPKENSDGTVDFRELNLIELVYEEQKLVTTFPPVPGKNGMNVLGRPLNCHPGKAKPNLPVGKNVKVTPDGDTLVAAVNGQINFINRKISVSPILDIKGDVGPKTGNINFNGAIIVGKNVLTGYEVEADGNIEVYGAVEGATINSGADVFAYSGVQGKDKAIIKASGDIQVKFAERCTLEANGNIVSNSILHSEIKSNGTVEILGAKGALVGGKTIASFGLVCGSIGSAMSTSTIVQVGASVEVVEEYQILVNHLQKLKQEHNKLTVIVENIRSKPLTNEKKELLIISMENKILLKEKIIKTNERLEIVSQRFKTGNGYIKVTDKIYDDANIILGGINVTVTEDMVNCTLRPVDGKIVVTYNE